MAYTHFYCADQKGNCYFSLTSDRTGGEGAGNHPGDLEILPGASGELSHCDRRIRQARPFACNLTATEKTKPRQS